MHYKVTVPPAAEQGSYKTIVSSNYGESYRARALWDYNSARAHDGLPPVSRMPAGTIYAPIVEYVLQGNYGYGHGWEDLTAEETRKECRERLREYQENEGGSYRIVKRAVEPATSKLNNS
jgi:hypothetical protein